METGPTQGPGEWTGQACLDQCGQWVHSALSSDWAGIFLPKLQEIAQVLNSQEEDSSP